MHRISVGNNQNKPTNMASKNHRIRLKQIKESISSGNLEGKELKKLKRERRELKSLIAASKEIHDKSTTQVETQNGDGSEGEDDEDEQPMEITGDDKAVKQLEGGKKKKTSQRVVPALEDTSFDSLEGTVNARTLNGIRDMGFTHMTEIQYKAIPHLLEGRDLMGAAKTGSGKTLAFLIPAIELIHKSYFRHRNGTGVIVLSPARELAMQTFGVLRKLLKHHHHNHGLLMGGKCREEEVEKLKNGVTLLVATPGRLLDHLQNTPDFMVKNLMCLIIDEADRMLDMGFEDEMRKIIALLPEKRQTMLFSATPTRKIEDLARISLKKGPFYIGVDDAKEQATVAGLEQGYVVCEPDKRFLLLFTFLKKNKKKKVMVFLSSCMAVQFYTDLLNYIDLEVMGIHGKQKQGKRTEVFFQFSHAESGILLCTDVAARGLDIPQVDWIVQYDPPDDPKEYIHRVGRTARGENGSGSALLFLTPQEIAFLHYLQKAKIQVNEFQFYWSKVADIQPQLEKLMSKNRHLQTAGRLGFKGYVRSYISHKQKRIFDVDKLDLQKLAKSFGFATAPFSDLSFITRRESKAKKDKQKGPIIYAKQIKKSNISKKFR